MIALKGLEVLQGKKLLSLKPVSTALSSDGQTLHCVFLAATATAAAAATTTTTAAATTTATATTAAVCGEGGDKGRDDPCASTPHFCRL